jgi:hypothetical protein
MQFVDWNQELLRDRFMEQLAPATNRRLQDSRVAIHLPQLYCLHALAVTAGDGFPLESRLKDAVLSS